MRRENARRGLVLVLRIYVKDSLESTIFAVLECYQCFFKRLLNYYNYFLSVGVCVIGAALEAFPFKKFSAVLSLTKLSKSGCSTRVFIEEIQSVKIISACDF